MRKTPLNNVHREAGAKLIDFGGWEMPVQYQGIIAEHRAVRNYAGLFDASHMGEILLRGPDVLLNLQRLVTNNVARLKIGQIIYTPMCREDGGIIDDLLIYRMAEEEYMMVVNAANIKKDYQWVKSHIIGNIKVKNVSDNYALIAIQGPKSLNILKNITDIELENLKYYNFKKGKVADIDLILSKTGYTGELGYELYCSPEQVEILWKELMNTGKEKKLVPAGLGARNTLRLEKKYCLYGNDIDENRHPLEAGLSWTIDYNKEFIGKASLLHYKKNGYKEKLVGFKLLERGIARHGYKVMLGEDIIGVVSSGSYSPTLDENIGLAYIEKDYIDIGQEIQVLIRNRGVKAVIVKTPFV